MRMVGILFAMAFIFSCSYETDAPIITNISDLPKQVIYETDIYEGDGELMLIPQDSDSEGVPAGKIQNGQVLLDLPEIAGELVAIIPGKENELCPIFLLSSINWSIQEFVFLWYSAKSKKIKELNLYLSAGWNVVYSGATADNVGILFTDSRMAKGTLEWVMICRSNID